MGINDRIDPFWQAIHRAQAAQFNRTRSQDIANATTTEAVRSMENIARAYPHMSPGVIRALGQSGYDPDNPAVVYAAYMEAAQQGASPQGFAAAYGDRIDFSGFSGRAREFALSRQTPTQEKESQALQQMGYSPNAPRVERGQRLEERRFQAEHDPWYLQGVTGRAREQAHTAFREQQRAATARMGYGQPSLESMSAEQLAELLIQTAPQSIRDMGGLDRDRMRELVQSDRGQAIQRIREQTGEADVPWYRKSAAENIGSLLPEPVRAAPAATDRQLGSIPGVAGGWSAVKGASRIAGAVVEAPFQELNTIVRNIYGIPIARTLAMPILGGQQTEPFALEGEGEFINIGEASNLGIMIEQALKGEPVNTGQGFFVDPESEVARIRREREVLQGTIGGHAPTVGRMFADQFFEPDTQPFNFVSGTVDAGVAWYADPFAIIPYGQISRTRHAFQPGRLDEAYEAAGLINGVRKYTNPRIFRDWVTQDARGRAAVQFFTETDDPYLIDKYSNWQLGPDASRRLAERNSERTVIQVMDSLVNKGKVRTTTQFTGSRPYRMWMNTQEARRIFNPMHSGRGYNRLTQRLPNEFIYIGDKNNVAEAVRRIGTNANLPEENIRTAYNMVARAKNPTGILNGADRIVQDVQETILDKGFSDPIIHLRNTRHNEDVKSLVQTIGADNPNPIHIVINGDSVEIGDVHHSLQALTQYWQVGGSAREIRRMTSPFRFLTDADTLKPIAGILKNRPGVLTHTSAGDIRLPFSMMDNLAATMSLGFRGGTEALDKGMRFLKAGWLLRIAWPVRFMAEEQIRIANSPLDTAGLFDHPIKVLAIQMGKRKRLDPSGNFIDQLEEFNYAQVRGHGNWVGDQQATPRGTLRTFAKDNPAQRRDFDYNWANDLAHLSQHPVVNHLMNHTREETLDWLLKGKGRRQLRQQRDIYGGLENRNQINSWLDVLTGNVRTLTNNDTDLINAIRTGNYQNVVPIYLEDASVNPAFRKIVTAHHDVNAPPFMRGLTFTTTKADYDGVLDRLMGGLWNTLFTKPANFDRQHFFRQALWRHTEELIGGASKSAQKRILQTAREDGMKGEELSRLTHSAQRAHGRLTQDDITALASGYALDDTKALLYDLTERRQWADVMRIMVPFGDAYQEIIQSWSRLITQQKGKPLYRLKQIVEAARDPGSGDTLGTGVDGKGFFYEDELGTESFNYPGSQFLTQALTGIPIPLSGRVQGLNMAGNFVPGFGPVIQMPAAYFIDKYPSLEVWRDLLVPFGAPGSGETDILNPLNYGPAWLRKFVQAVGNGAYNQRLYNNQIMAAYAYKISTGEYGHTPEELQRAMEDATLAVSGDGLGHIGIFGITALGAFMLPASPSPRELIEDDEGRLLSIAAISKDYWEKVDETSYEEANGWFLSTFGEDAIGAIVPRTAAVATAVPRTLEQGAWWDANPGLAAQFPQVYGLFGPQGGEFHYPTYIDSILKGYRDALTPQEFLEVMNDWMGNYWYGRVREDTGGDNPTDEQRAQRSQIFDQIKEDYPFWDNKPGQLGLPRRPEDAELIPDLQRALTHPELANTPAGQALTYYFDARENAIQEVDNYNNEWGTTYTSFREANDLRYIRDYLRGVAERIIEDYPDFENMWDTVLNRELSQDFFGRS